MEDDPTPTPAPTPPNPDPTPAPTPPNPDPTPDPPSQPDRVGILEERVNELENIVTGLTQGPDSSPTGKPWTHRKVF